MADHLYNSPEGIDIAVLLQPSHVFCGYNNVDYLNDFRGLDTDAGKTNPAVIACAAVRSKEHKRNKKGKVNAAEQLPLLSQEIRINKRQSNESNNPQKQREYLNDDAFDGTVDPAGCFHGNGCDTYHIDTEQGADQAHNQQKDIRTFPEHVCVDFNLFDAASPPFFVLCLLKVIHPNIREPFLQGF